eukprot:CAMPEP_0195080232 /NCGR_PEP_ID=MMETSP0448-20130528/21975_1 /TAXON_ID=66468 /ORGANISM="Heterocapsa triquestra, Strain CCMP 448" /LENGTH=107 /DNA_ID=CAMNT_0040113157 /DNA_START=258 /DNA_END=577 /DNA_ORIENTATION=+
MPSYKKDLMGHKTLVADVDDSMLVACSLRGAYMTSKAVGAGQALLQEAHSGWKGCPEEDSDGQATPTRHSAPVEGSGSFAECLKIEAEPDQALDLLPKPRGCLLQGG